jgi:hypothetical protein
MKNPEKQGLKMHSDPLNKPEIRDYSDITEMRAGNQPT